MERLRFNRCVAHIYTLANALEEALRAGVSQEATGEAAGILVQLIAPMMPHLAEASWAALGRDGLVASAPWPILNRSLLVEDEITLPVQINGKVKSRINVAADADQDAVFEAAFADAKVADLTSGKNVVKKIYVPGRMVNLVVK